METDDSAFRPQNPGTPLPAQTDGSQAGTEKPSPPRGSRIPMAVLLFFVGVTLVLMVSLPALISVERNEATMNRLLAEKGSALIMSFENILRTGMRSQVGIRLQALLEEMNSAPDITFIAVTMPDGTIISDSNPNRVGEILSIDGREADLATMHRLSPNGSVRWGIMNMEGTRSFVVYRNFLPSRGQIRPGTTIPMIFLGLNMSPLVITRDQNRAYVTMLAGVTLLIGLACLIALYYAERARQSRLRQRRAESRVRALEEEVRRKEKLAAVGTLAAGVAHEIRNPLSSIKGYATYFGQLFPEGSEDRTAAQVMVSEVERLNRVITELIGLSRPTDVTVRPTLCANILEHVSRLISKAATARHVRLFVRSPEEGCMVQADPDRLGQALLNLCLNALDAMPDGGSLYLAAVRAEGRICISVRDTGIGIPEANLQHIFDPYFTTKAKGTGIGLATVHKIVVAQHGEIGVVSRPATGSRSGETTFRIWLPEADASRTAAAPQNAGKA